MRRRLFGSGKFICKWIVTTKEYIGIGTYLRSI